MLDTIRTRRRKRPTALRLPSAWYNGNGDITTCLSAFNARTTTYNAARTNLVTPGTYDLIPGVNPYWSQEKGFMFRRDLGSWLDTQITPLWDYTVICRFSNASNGADALFGAEDAHSGTACFWVLFTVNDSRNIIEYAWADAIGYKWYVNLQGGVVALAGDTGYWQGVKATAAMDGLTDWSGPSNNIYLGAYNSSDEAHAHIDADVQALAIYSSKLTAAQISVVGSYMLLL